MNVLWSKYNTRAEDSRQTNLVLNHSTSAKKSTVNYDQWLIPEKKISVKTEGTETKVKTSYSYQNIVHHHFFFIVIFN